MIIDDCHKFVFVHVPKCAGTSVRNILEPFNNWECAGPPWQVIYEPIGLLDFGHIPLFTLREHFPSDYEKVRQYWSFSVIRDPFARFSSSVSQRIKMYGKRPLQSLTQNEIKSEIDHSIDFLRRQPKYNHLLPAEYIHFQKQTDYIKLDGVQVVDTLYAVNEVKRLLWDVSQHVKADLLTLISEDEPHHVNKAEVYRNEILRKLVNSIGPVKIVASKCLPKSVRTALKKIVYVPRDERLQFLFEAAYVKEFVRDYYKEDILLWQQVIQSDK